MPNGQGYPEYLYLPGWQPAPGWQHGHVEALVDCSVYTGEPKPDWRWCRLEHVAPGSLSTYPFKCKVPGKGIGQWNADEVRMWRADLEVLRSTSTAHAVNGDRHGRFPS